MAKALIIIGVVSCILNSLSHGDKEIFQISSYNDYHDDESENEIIKAADFFKPQILKRDENKYKPLHSYVKQENQRITKTKIQIPNVVYHSPPDKRKIFNLFPKVKPHIARLTNKLNKYYLEKSTKESVNATKNKRNVLKHNKLDYNNIFEDYINFVEMEGNTDSMKLNNYQEEDPSPLLSINIEEINRYIQLSSTISLESTLESRDENIYDYNALKMNYEQQIEKDKNINDTLNHKKEDVTVEPLEKVTDFNNTRNCTEKDMNYLNIKAIKCLFHNYQYLKGKSGASKKMLSNIFLMIKIWLCIYICIAIPCWCQRGWCCCCFRCKICFPQKRIILAKQYYVRNPPGILMPKFSKKKSIKYEPSEIEQDMYEQFETAIRNI